MISSIACGIAVSLHLGLIEDYEYNALHPYCKATTEHNVIAGAYYNSVDNLTVFLGYEYDINNDISIEVGIATGYDSTLLTPTAKINYK